MVWNSENRKLQNAAKRVNKFRDIKENEYDGIIVKETESGETVITIELTPEDIWNAPKAVKRIVFELKLKESDMTQSGNFIYSRRRRITRK